MWYTIMESTLLQSKGLACGIIQLWNTLVTILLLKSSESDVLIIVFETAGIGYGGQRVRGDLE